MPPSSTQDHPTETVLGTVEPRLYRVGTLAYTKSRLIQVVFWMLCVDFIFQLLQAMSTVTPLLLRWQGASDTLIGLVSVSLNQGAIAVYLAAGMALAPRLLPKENYGRFVSANLIFGMIGMIFAPPLIGRLLEQAGDYRYAFMFCGILTALASVAMLMLYAQWKQFGGDVHFAPPEPVPKTPSQ